MEVEVPHRLLWVDAVTGELDGVFVILGLDPLVADVKRVDGSSYLVYVGLYLASRLSMLCVDRH